MVHMVMWLHHRLTGFVNLFNNLSIPAILHEELVTKRQKPVWPTQQAAYLIHYELGPSKTKKHILYNTQNKAH